MWYTKMIVRGSAVFPRYIGQISISIEVYRDMNVFKKIFGTSSQREVKAIMPLVDKVLALEEEYKALSDHELQAKTGEFKERLQKGETLDDILPEAFAACREADWRVLGMRPYPVQIIGGIILHQGRIAEMKTGEGKTLVATLPAYLNALSGKGVHIVTVNDYLAKRDSEWMGKVYRFMGLTVGLVIHDVPPRSARPPTTPTSPTAPTTSSASTTCGTTWPSTPRSWSSGATPSPSWTRWTPFSSTRPAPP